VPLKYLNINDILKDILLSSEQIIDQEITFLSARYADIEPVIECNPDIMKQVLLTLILNALQAIQKGDRLDIRTNYLPEIQTAEIHLIHNAPSALKTIRSSTFDHLSQKEERGTGLGLAIIHNIVNMYKGSIRMEYIEGGGTAFVLSFPVVSAKMTNIDPQKKPSENKAANA
jgi:signal transduction histidine kinase